MTSTKPLASADAHIHVAELHQVRGEILLKRDPANPAPAEEAFQTAIAVAKQQGTRSFELRAALALAKQGARRQAQRDAASSLRVQSSRHIADPSGDGLFRRPAELCTPLFCKAERVSLARKINLYHSHGKSPIIWGMSERNAK